MENDKDHKLMKSISEEEKNQKKEEIKAKNKGKYIVKSFNPKHRYLNSTGEKYCMS